MKKYLLFAFVALLFLEATAQDKVELTDGRILKGKITLIDKEKVVLSTASNVYECPLVQIKYFEKDGIVYDPIGLNLENKKVLGTSAGDDLIKSANAFYTGTVLMIIGGAVTSIGTASYFNKPNDTNKIMVYAGSGLSFVGMIVQLSSFSFIAKAGKKLNLSSGNNGLTLSYNF